MDEIPGTVRQLLRVIPVEAVDPLPYDLSLPAAREDEGHAAGRHRFHDDDPEVFHMLGVDIRIDAVSLGVPEDRRGLE